MLHIRLAESGLTKIDEVRGEWSRSEYVRQALRYAIKNDMKGPRKVTWE
jgi:metal-responsive CopG/Arc/MetJ family transcriptional regulator